VRARIPGGKWLSSTHARTDGMQIRAYLSTSIRKEESRGLLPEARGPLLSASADVGRISSTLQNRPERRGGALPRERAGIRTVCVQAVTEHRPPPLSRPRRAIILLARSGFSFGSRSPFNTLLPKNARIVQDGPPSRC